MQRLLFLREPRHDVSDKCRHHVGDDLAEVASRRAPKADAPSGHIRHQETKRFFPDRGLPLRALQQRVVQPRQDQAERRGEKDQSDEHEDANIIHVFARMNLVEECTQSRQKNQRNHYQDETQTQQHVVNKERQKSQPESCELHARYGGVSGIRRDGRRATSYWYRNRCTHHWRPQRRSGNREHLSAIRAKHRTIRHHTATLGTIHSVSFAFSLSSPEYVKIAAKSYLQARAGSILDWTTQERQEFHRTSTHSFFVARLRHSVHLIDFAYLSQTHEDPFGFGSFRASPYSGHP